MSESAGASLTGELSSIAVESEFESERMHIGCEGGDAIREADGVSDDGTRTVTRRLPAIVDIHVIVA